MQRLKQIDSRIEKIKQQLNQVGDMRPGSVSLQYRDAKTEKHPYHQLNWIVGSNKQSEYVSQRNLEIITEQTVTYKHFKALCAEWVELSVERSKLSLKLEREKRRTAS
jgi:hypothetical protein